MKKQVIDHFTSLGLDRVTFNPAIQIKMSPHLQPTFIDDMSKVNNTYFFTVGKLNHSETKNIDSLSPEELQSVSIRLWSMANKNIHSQNITN